MHRDNTDQLTVRVDLDKDIPEYADGYARAKITDVVRFAPRAVLFVKIRLTLAGSHRHPDVVAHANLDVNGTPSDHPRGGQDRLRGRRPAPGEAAWPT